MSSLSQEESRSISENMKWGQRKRFADGKTSVAFSRFLGYDQGEDEIKAAFVKAMNLYSETGTRSSGR